MDFETLEHIKDSDHSGEDLGDKISELIETFGFEAVESALKSRADQDNPEDAPDLIH
ncbi:MAG: hypothetical protein Q8Q10_03145 [bacterium]|nr:hypothetical protein [bacterium]